MKKISLRLHLLSIMILMMPFLSFGQFTIAGKVIDKAVQSPLGGAHIILQGTFKATVSNPDGSFTFDKLKPARYTLSVSFLGFEDHTVDLLLRNDTMIVITMVISPLMQDEVIITGTRLNKNSPTTYSTISAKEIEEINLGQDLPYLLSSSPSVTTTSDAGSGVGYTSLRIRGTDLYRINVTLNGIPLNDAESQGVWWVDMPDIASSIDNIQIQRGAGTSNNGAAAFGASINIETNKFNADPYGSIDLSAGSFNTGKITVKAGTGLIKSHWSLDARYSRLHSDGYINRAFADLSSYYFAGTYSGKKNLVKMVVISGNEKTYQAWEGVPKNLLETDRTYNPLGTYYDKNGNLQYYDDQTDNYRQDHYQLFWSQEIASKWTMTLALHSTLGKGYYEDYKTDKDFADYGLEDVVIGADTISSTDLVRQKWLDNEFYGLILTANYNNKQRFKLNLGGAFNFYDGDHFGEIIWSEMPLNEDVNYRWYENNAQKTDGNIYAKADYKVTNTLNLFADLQYRGITYEIDGIDDDLRNITQSHNFNFLNPKLGAYYDLNTRNSAYLSFAVSNREPSRSTLVDATPNLPAPTSEQLLDIEAGHKYSSPNISLETVLFYMKYKDQLVLTGKINDIGVPVFENVPESYRAGIEFSYGSKPLRFMNWDGNLALSMNKISGFTEYIDNWDAWPEQLVVEHGTTDLSFSPAVVFNNSFDFEPVKNLHLVLGTKYVSSQYIDNTSSSERMLGAYFVNDFHARYSLFPGFMEELTFTVKMNNIFNEKYETNAWVYRYYTEGEYGELNGYFPQAGINFLIGITLKF